MAKDRASGEYAGVTLIESATRGHNGRTCTVIKFVIPRVTLIENFASRKTVKEKLNDRRIAEPPMDENSKKIRELTEAMHAERDIRIRNRMMAVLGVLKGHSTKITSDFADVDQRTVQLWVARFDEGGIGGLRDVPGRASRARYGRIRKLADRLAGKSMLAPRKLRNWIRWRLDARYICAACAGSCASSGSRPRGLLPCMSRQPMLTR